MYALSKLYNCGIFQGACKHRHYFEGWYFKHVDEKEKNSIAIIPGISYEESREKSHAFIQVIDGGTHQTNYVTFGLEEFTYEKERFEIRIGNNTFSDRGMRIEIDRPDIRITGSLSYSHMIPWHSSMFSPNSMGWYGFIPIMECYHGVLSMHHNITGSIAINERQICFDKGKGYMEKDWGTSFPSSWIWLQSNHFEHENISFMLSVAKIPWHQKSFTGFIIGFWYKGKLYRFATYTGARLEALKYYDSSVELSIRDQNYQLKIKARLGNTGALQAPIKGAMVGSVQESMNANLDILLTDHKLDATIFDGKARCCGMEIAGNIQELVNLP